MEKGRSSIISMVMKLLRLYAFATCKVKCISKKGKGGWKDLHQPQRHKCCNLTNFRPARRAAPLTTNLHPSIHPPRTILRAVYNCAVFPSSIQSKHSLTSSNLPLCTSVPQAVFRGACVFIYQAIVLHLACYSPISSCFAQEKKFLEVPNFRLGELMRCHFNQFCSFSFFGSKIPEIERA